MSSLEQKAPSSREGLVLIGFKVSPKVAQELKLLCAIDNCNYRELFIKALGERLDEARNHLSNHVSSAKTADRTKRKLIRATSAA